MRRGVAIATMLALSGCMVGPDYRRPATELPGSFAQSGGAGQAAAAIPGDWWRLFGDPVLDDLVESALAVNVDIAQAVARIEEADANLRAVNAALFPEIDLAGAAVRSASSTKVAAPAPPIVRNDVRLAFTTSYEIDFWGKLRRASEAARATDLSTRYARDVVTLSVAALTTQTYFLLRSLDAQIAATRATLASRDDTLTIVRRRADGGLASDLEVRQAEGARSDAAFQLDELLRERSLAEHLLATVTGRLDLAIPAGDLAHLPLPAMPPPGLPSTMLERRPDIRQAEQDLVTASAEIGVARAQMFPTITLTGAFGGESASLAGLFTVPGRIWALGAGLSAPIFEAGRLSALVDVQRARERQALAAYQRSIQTAFREVEDALTNVQRYAALEGDAQASVDAAREALRLANVRYGAGYTGFLDVLDSQRSLNIAELALIRSRQNLLSAGVDLMMALGGGWEPAAAEGRSAGPNVVTAASE
ncbi:MAG TPA: efflux transporter outer membrane subunit [Casimicrobiaceae bacterium]|nr:efflux transporter outer membrane subunit [Casimicrobiaceae bacterium]